MDQIELKVDRRETLGKKVRFLRRQGITPVHVFGSGIDSAAFQCDTVALRQVLAEAGHTQLINIQAPGEKTPRPAVVAEIQTAPRSGELLHVDFHQVNMAEEIRVEVPIVLVGEAPALKLKENMLMHELNTVEVECLPSDIPTSIEVDITGLVDDDSEIRVKDLLPDSKVTVLDDPEALVVRIAVSGVAREREAAAAEAEAKAEAAGAPGEEEVDAEE